jgi:hypothetical protein
MASSQLELFDQTTGPQAAHKGESRIFLSYLLRYEKTIIVFICIIITNVIAFSVGVERGKQWHQPQTLPPAHPISSVPVRVAPEAQPISVPVLTQTNAAVKPQTQSVTQKDVLTSQGFTIQIASFQTGSAAQAAASQLKKKGFSAQTITKGKFTILCVGTYATRKNAEAVLVQLKKKYQDCYIRRL